ncbi:MAG TPA: hypothetical protein VLJ61_13305, partial [Pyrinomonadaceae bacterium]|nr:hypothetical protein [Pyrinomonadaceae bacterium]
ASVRSNRRMSAIVAISFQDSLASGLAQDKGAVAFYAGSKSKFCPVLRSEKQRDEYASYGSSWMR